MPPASTKSKTAQDNADYARELRTRRKEQGFIMVHWYVHQSVYDTIAKAAARENRNVQQFVSLNVGLMIPEDLRPKKNLDEPVVIPKKKRVVLNIKVQRSSGHPSKQS